MANEITISASLNAVKGGVQIGSGSFTKSIDMAGEDMIQASQNIGLSPETLNLGELATIGMLLVYNLDTTNYVELALDSGMSNKIARITPGAFALFRPTVATIYAAANTAACQVMVCAVEA